MFLWAIGYKGGVDWQKPRNPWTDEERIKHGLQPLPKVSIDQLSRELDEMKALLKGHMNAQRPRLPGGDK